MNRKRKFTILEVILAIALVFVFAFYAQTQEDITITTYYPSPFGSYRELRTNNMVVHSTRAMPTGNGNLNWGAGLGQLSASQGGSIELGGAGASTPYIDFHSDNTAADYHGRIIQQNSTHLRINAEVVRLRNRADSNWTDLEVRDLFMCHQ